MSSLQKVASSLLWPVTSICTAYMRAAERRPFVVGVVTTGIKTSAADLFAQKVMERREDIDWTRQAAFTAFGFVYLGAFQYFFYQKVLGVLAQPITNKMGHIASSPIKTFIDQAIHHPFLYFPSFYYLKYTLVKGEDVSVAFDKYQEELWPNCKALWTIWVPAQLLNFSVVPAHLNIPVAAAVSFVWTIVLSMMRGAFDEKKDLYEHVEEIETDAEGHPDLEHRAEAGADGATHAIVPSALERIRPSCSVSGRVYSCGFHLHPNSSVLKRCTAAPGSLPVIPSLLALQHPLDNAGHAGNINSATAALSSLDGRWSVHDAAA